MERLARLDLLALLDLLGREESKDSLDPLASRVCLDLLDPQERVASLVTREFLGRAELLVLLDLEVNVVSPVREVELDLRVCRDRVDFLELPELMDQRAPSGQPVLQELRGPQVCRACQEREELVVSPEPRETEVITVRKDLRELLERTVLEV